MKAEFKVKKSISLSKAAVGKKSFKYQQGAFGIQGALTLFLAVLFAVLAIDSGRLMQEKKRLQSVADMAALDASSLGGNCGNGNLAEVVAEAQLSAARNNHALTDGGTLQVSMGDVVAGNDGIRAFTVGDPTTAMAVEVTAGNTVPASLIAGGLFGDQINLQATAVAERTAIAGFSAGSGLLNLNTEASILNALLGGVLGSTVNLDLVSYQGIAVTNVTLLNIIEAAAGVGTVDELLSANLSVGELLQVFAQAVSASNTASVDAIAATELLANATVSDLSVNVGDILSVTTPDVEQAATVDVNLLDLLTTTILVANGQHAIELPLGVSLLGLHIDTFLTVIEPPQIAIGPPGKNADGDWITQTHTAQIRLDTTVTGGLNLLLVSVDVDLDIGIEVASGDAWLDNIDCYNSTNPITTVTIGTQPGLATVALSGTEDPSDPATISVRLLLGLIKLADIEAGLSLPLVDPNGGDLEYTVAVSNETPSPGTDPCLNDLLPCTKRVDSSLGGSLENGLTQLFDELQLQITLAGLSLNIVNDLVTGLVGPLIVQLSSALPALLDPLLRILGIQVGYLDVQLFVVDISRPKLLI